MKARTMLWSGMVMLETEGREPQPFELTLCAGCEAPVVDPAEDGWVVDLVKVGRADGPVLAYLVPHRPECGVEPVKPEVGLAVRVPMRFLQLGGRVLERHEFEPSPFVGPGGTLLSPDWCGYGALQEAFFGVGFCGRTADDEVHGGGRG